MNKNHMWAAAAVFGMAIAACGGGDDDSGLGGLGDLGDLGQESGLDDSDEQDLEDFANAMNEAQGAGGGGILTFDGVEYVIDSAVCVKQGGRIDIGTIGAEGYRVFVSGDPADLNLQILTPEGMQRFDGDRFSENKSTVTIDGNTVTATGGKFFSNQDDVLIAAEFTIDCPQAIL